MVSFYFPEYFVGTVSTQGLIPGPAPCQVVPPCQQTSPAPQPRGPVLAACQRAPAVASSSHIPAPALLTTANQLQQLPCPSALQRYQPSGLSWWGEGD